MKKLTNAVYGILTTFGYLNAYLIVHGDVITLVDTGAGAGFQRSVQRALVKIDRTLADIRHIIITHAHPDHVGGLAAIQQHTNATTYAHRRAASVIRREQPTPRPASQTLGPLNRLVRAMSTNLSFSPGRIDVEIGDGDTLDTILPGLQVIHLPGHAPGQIGLYLTDEKTLIGGDVMMRLPWGLSVPFKGVSPDWDAAKDSIRRVGELDLDNLLLGHGAPLLGDAQSQVRDLVNRLK